MFDEPTIDITLPPGWHRRSDPESGVIVAARPREFSGTGHVPEVVVRTTPVESGLLEWRDDAQVELASHLPGFVLEDADSYALGDHDVDYRRFSHTFGATDVITEQWSWLIQGIGITLSCTTARTDYAIYGDLFEQIAGTVVITARAA